MQDIAANAGKLIAKGKLSKMKGVKVDSSTKRDAERKQKAQPEAGSGEAGDPDSKSSGMIMPSMRTMGPVQTIENLLTPTIALDYNQLTRGVGMNMLAAIAPGTERVIDLSKSGIPQFSNRALDSRKDSDESLSKSVNFRSPTGYNMKDKFPGLFPLPKKETGSGFELPTFSLNRLPVDLPEIKDEPEDESPYHARRSLRINQEIKKSLRIDGDKFNKHAGGIQFSNTDYTNHLINDHRNYDSQDATKVPEKLTLAEEIRLNLSDGKSRKDKMNQITNFSMFSANDEDMSEDGANFNTSINDKGELKGIGPTVVGLNAKIMNRYPYFRMETPDAGSGLVLKDKRRVMLGNLAGSGFLHSFENRGTPDSPRKFGGENEYGMKKGKTCGGGTMALPSLTNGPDGLKNQKTFCRFLNQLKNVKDESV